MKVFGKEHEVGDVLATADFHLTGTGYGDVPVDVNVHAELLVSGAFQYGNQTCMTFEWSNNHSDESYDTRYEKVTPDNFTEFAKSVLDSKTKDTVTVEVM